VSIETNKTDCRKYFSPGGGKVIRKKQKTDSKKEEKRRETKLSGE